MNKNTLLIFLAYLIIFVCSCVDRIDLDTGLQDYPIVVEGFISDQPGPYEIRVSRSFDVQSKSDFKESVSVKRITLSDNIGNAEELEEISQGRYRTSVNGIAGVVGRSYKIYIELLDGRIYESIPDEMTASGSVESVYASFVSEQLQDLTTQYGFDIAFDAKLNEDGNSYIMWRFDGTYQIDTNPESHTEPCGEARCPKPRPCSGWILVSGELRQEQPCECCTCWVNFVGDVPVLSDNNTVANGKYTNIKAQRVPLNEWFFMHKLFARVNQMSLTPRAFAFWKAIREQKQASGSLFQPIAGVVPNNYVQITGESKRLEGFFFATAITSKGIFITRNDVPNQALIPLLEVPYTDSCLNFPNSTNNPPDFWR